jgi:fumarate hydratase class II
MESFDHYCTRGLEPDRPRIAQLLENSLMLVTALSPHIGYDRAADIAKHAHLHGTSLRIAAIASGAVSESQFDAWVQPRNMV